jgi:site-specific DNA recombinase
VGAAGVTTRRLPAAAEPTLRVAVYLRISTDEAHQPFSLDAQEHRLTAFIASQPGWTLARKPYVDQISGAYDEQNRRGLRDLLRDARLDLFDIVLVYRVDRFARSLKVLVHLLEELDTAGVAFRSATEPIDTSTPTGRMLVQLLGVFAEFERATIIDRVIAGMERKAARGEWTAGGRPYGYRIDPDSRHLVVDEDEAPLIGTIFDLYLGKRLGVQAIAKKLNERGRRTKAGRPWSGASVLTVLRNRSYLGEIYFRGTWHAAPHPPLVTQDRFAAAAALLAERGEDVARRRTNPSDYLLSGLLLCGKCGKHYLGTKVGGNRYTYRYYICFSRQRYGPDTCASDRIPAEELDAAILDSLQATYQRIDLFDAAAEAAAAKARDGHETLVAELAGIDAEARRTDEAIERYLLAFENGTLPEDRCGERVRGLALRASELRQRRAELEALLDDAYVAPPTQADLDKNRGLVAYALDTG